MVASDVITLDNLSQKIPQWSPDDDSHLYAIVDMGRYTVSLANNYMSCHLIDL